MQPAWVDIDNDGDNDFFVSRYDETPFLFLNDGDMNFIDISDHLPCPYAYPASTGASWGDYNNDSYLDLYMCNYHNQGVGPTSWLFHNNGDGTFEEVASELNCDNGISMAFQSIWLDLDNDHDQDLIVVNDNNNGSKMYINEGADGFNNIATMNGFDVLGDLMGVSFSDLEHDGDFDFMITNNQGNILMINDSGHYSNKASMYGVDVYCTSWSCLFIDAANDTYEDLYVLSNASCSNNSNYFYDNTDGYHLILNEPMVGGDLPAYSCSKGDFDQDGKYDIIITNGYQTIDMQLWQNKYEAGNFIKLDLNGTISNLHGIGSIVKCYVNDQMLLRAVSSGDNYLSQDSQYMNIGIAQSETIDSLLIQWPSGWTDKFYNLPVNQLYTITEGETFASNHETEIIEVCPNSEVTLTAPDGYNHLWSNDVVGATNTTSGSGYLTVYFENIFGLSDSAVYLIEESHIPNVEIDVQAPSCYQFDDGIVVVTTSLEDITHIIWSDGNSSMNRYDLLPGEYELNITWTNLCSSNYVVDVPSVEPIILMNELNLICSGDSDMIEPTITGGIPPYSIETIDQVQMWNSVGEYAMMISDSHGCISFDTLVIEFYPEINFSYAYETPCYGESATMEYHAIGGFGELHAQPINFNPEMIYAGSYAVEITDDAGCHRTFDFIIEENPQIEVTYDLINPNGENAGSILLHANGGSPPYNFFWNTDENNNPIAITNTGNYNCLIIDQLGCTQTIQIAAINTIVEEEKTENATCFPNPFEEVTNYIAPSNRMVDIFDLTGKKTQTIQLNVGMNTLDLAHLSSGVYFFYDENQKIILLKK